MLACCVTFESITDLAGKSRNSGKTRERERESACVSMCVVEEGKKGRARERNRRQK